MSTAPVTWPLQADLHVRSVEQAGVNNELGREYRVEAVKDVSCAAHMTSPESAMASARRRNNADRFARQLGIEGKAANHRFPPITR
jgi:hypothetical protein